MKLIDKIICMLRNKKKAKVHGTVESKVNAQSKSGEKKQSGEEEKKRSENDLNIAINPLITTKDVRDQLWNCRDFELSHLWQRSIFLTTLLVLCLTAYGVVVMELVDKVSTSPVQDSAFVLNNIAMIICLMGFVFSCLWVMMSKGSKAWYEMYERAISAFEANPDYVDKLLLDSGKEIKQDANSHKAIGGFRFDNLQGFSNRNARKDICSCLFSCKGGAYSPSKINIAIGQITLVLWGVALVTHYVLAQNEFQFNGGFIRKDVSIGLLIIFIVVAVYLFCFPESSWVKSGRLNEIKFGSDKPKK